MIAPLLIAPPISPLALVQEVKDRARSGVLCPGEKSHRTPYVHLKGAIGA